MFLIDWEYAGMNDGIWDLAELSIEASYEHGQDELLLTAYLGRKPLPWIEAISLPISCMDYLWTLWAKPGFHMTGSRWRIGLRRDTTG